MRRPGRTRVTYTFGGGCRGAARGGGARPRKRGSGRGALALAAQLSALERLGVDWCLGLGSADRGGVAPASVGASVGAARAGMWGRDLLCAGVA